MTFSMLSFYLLVVIYISHIHCKWENIVQNRKNQFSYFSKPYSYSNKLTNPIPWNCTKEVASQKFSQKILVNPFDSFEEDPYQNMTLERQNYINSVIDNKEIVCAIKYLDVQKKHYEIKQFLSKEEANENGYIVTHQGHCDRCSTLQDLAIYLRTDLTIPVAMCGMKGFVSLEEQKKCLIELGFTGPCAEIWYYNTQNTVKLCNKQCMKMLVFKIPFVKPDGSLNSCLQCDEDESGPVFKYYSGRTRRNSGIESEIPRPSDSIYPMNQCYY